MIHISLFINQIKINRNCKLEFNFISKDKTVHTYSKRIFDCAVMNGTTYVDFDSPNVIYLITCDRCPLQYIEERVQNLNERFNRHRTGFKKPRKCGFCCLLSNNFLKSICKNATY